MAPIFNRYEYEEKPKHQHWTGTQGSCNCSYDFRKVASSTMPSWGPGQYYNNGQKPLTEKQRQHLWLFEKQQEEIKRYWKKDQYAKVKAQIRL